jgi:hypothetical protein
MLGEYERVLYGEELEDSLTPLLTATDYADEVAADADGGEIVDEEEELVGKGGSDEWVEVATTKGIEDGLCSLLF